MITEIIKPIELLKGSHADTGKTGHGCFMNVIAYLNGEPQITDNSPCVCFVVKPIAIWLNDYLTTKERELMIPYIERAMGSYSDDPAIFIPRAEAAARFAIRCSEIVARYAGDAARAAARAAARVAGAAARDAARYARYAGDAARVAGDAARDAGDVARVAGDAARDAARDAGDAARAAARAAARVARKNLIEAAFIFLDESLPQATDPQPIVIERAKALIAITA